MHKIKHQTLKIECPNVLKHYIDRTQMKCYRLSMYDPQQIYYL